VIKTNQFKFGNNHELQNTNVLLVLKFLRDLTEAGIYLPRGRLALQSRAALRALSLGSPLRPSLVFDPGTRS
jgi:hypothetical protein